jgi:putative peptide zinc metalloprotease protein
VLFILPWPSRIGTSGLLQPSQQVVLYAPPHARVSALPKPNSSAVAANQPVLELDSPDLQFRNEQTTARQARLAQQSATAGFDAGTQKDWLVLEQQLAAAEAERSTVVADGRLYHLQAPYASVLHDLDPDLRPGQWVAQRETLGRLVGNAPWQVVTYVDEDNIERLSAGDRALFVADGMSGPNLRLRVASIDKTASNTLPEGELASLFGGHVPVREKQGVLYPERAHYRVVLTVETDERPRQHSWRGRVSIAGTWEAPGLHYLRTALAGLRREAGF